MHFSMVLEMKLQLLIGWYLFLISSMLMDLMSSLTQVIFHSLANVPVLRDRVTRDVMSDKTTGNSLFQQYSRDTIQFAKFTR